MPSTMDRIAGQVLFPVSNFLFNRRGIMSSYRSLCRSDVYPQSVLREMQLQGLKNVLAHAYRYVPFYQERFRKCGFVPGDLRRLEDVRHLPPLTRQEVIEHHREMVDSRVRHSIPFAERSGRGPGEPIPFSPFRRHRLVRNTSSGSTGAPTIFYEDGSRTALNWAYEFRTKHWYGIEPGENEARMARLSTIYRPKSGSLSLRKSLWHQLILPGTNLGENELEYTAHQLRSFRPAVLWGYTSAVTSLAEYLKRKPEDSSLRSVRLVITWAAPLHDPEKTLLERVFRCPVTNVYGAREVGHIAATCPSGSFHINQEHLLAESENSEDLTAEAKELLVTNLDLSPMPFIRYRMGDIGQVSGRSCRCGRTLQVLDGLLGRTGEVFVSRDGRIVSPNFWCRVFMTDRFEGQFRRFQVIYTRQKNLRILVVKGPGYSTRTEEYLRDIVRENFSPDTELDVEYVEEIRPQVSGKYQMVVNEGKRGME